MWPEPGRSITHLPGFPVELTAHEEVTMAMMMDRSPHGHCCCKVCVPPKYRQQVRSVYRAREKREWLREVRDALPTQHDAGDLSVMLDEHHEWADTRGRANTHFLRES